MPKIDKRIAHGTKCTWWDKAETVLDVGGMPLCPHCKKGVLYVESIEKWMQGIEDHGRNRPGFVAFVKWSQGKCFPDFDTAAEAYQRETGKTFTR